MRFSSKDITGDKFILNENIFHKGKDFILEK